MTFRMDEYNVTVLRTRDQYNDYSVAFDVTVKVADVVAGLTWTETFTCTGDDLESIKRGFRDALNNGWRRPNSEE